MMWWQALVQPVAVSFWNLTARRGRGLKDPVEDLLLDKWQVTLLEQTSPCFQEMSQQRSCAQPPVDVSRCHICCREVYWSNFPANILHQLQQNFMLLKLVRTCKVLVQLFKTNSTWK
jgi:hypothetical protein